MAYITENFMLANRWSHHLDLQSQQSIATASQPTSLNLE